MTDILCLSTNDLKRVLTFESVIQAVKEAYMAHSSKEGFTYPVIREVILNNAVFSVKAGYLPNIETLGLKAAGVLERKSQLRRGSAPGNRTLNRSQKWDAKGFHGWKLYINYSDGRPAAFPVHAKL
ncbi:hypothetical protein [Effusibacillus dendaii]|uniref:Uncharacterized protein n=1 Tax=Effusibacillus dendaii TaxID=2743772 RepID=A0A7I8D5Y5_9BACL|nr:hypothetical protein [Effusibacillus dendaii]BCJ85544.1 hypothetical protein skT53_05290 [Effusibacillus dendaii]